MEDTKPKRRLIRKPAAITIAPEPVVSEILAPVEKKEPRPTTPGYSPETYRPLSPAYRPRSPTYGPDSPTIYCPRSPTYCPGSPNWGKSPNSYSYTPSSFFDFSTSSGTAPENNYVPTKTVEPYSKYFTTPTVHDIFQDPNVPKPEKTDSALDRFIAAREPRDHRDSRRDDRREPRDHRDSRRDDRREPRDYRDSRRDDRREPRDHEYHSRSKGHNCDRDEPRRDYTNSYKGQSEYHIYNRRQPSASKEELDRQLEHYTKQ
jgi:hypothetical protein